MPILRSPTHRTTFRVEFDNKNQLISCYTGEGHRTLVQYRMEAVRDLWNWLRVDRKGEGVLIGTRGEEDDPNPGSVESWARSEKNPNGGYYGVTPGLRGRFGTFVPPVMEYLGLATVTHNARDNTIEANSMDERAFREIKRAFEVRLRSLENDAERAFRPLDDLQYSPFPIAMYCFALTDYFSSCWAGWNEARTRDLKNRLHVLPDASSQTSRISHFLVEFLSYDSFKSQLAINFWRHKTMHTGEPRILRDGEDEYLWCIADRAYKAKEYLVKEGFLKADASVENLGLYRSGKHERRQMFVMGAYDFIADLRRGVLGAGGYFDRLRTQQDLQERFNLFCAESQNYEFRSEKLDQPVLA